MAWVQFWATSPRLDPQYSPRLGGHLIRVRSRGAVLSEDQTLIRVRTWTWIAIALEGPPAVVGRRRLWVDPWYEVIVVPTLPPEVGADRVVVWGGYPAEGWRLEFEEWV